MGMVVRTNTMAMNANRQLGMNNSQVAKSLEKLSSGFRINRAADDASGLAISEKMKAQIKGLEQASSNSQDGISLVQTAEGAATEIHDMLNRMVELATKSANGTIQDEVDREAIQREVDDLNSEISRIASSTNFNGINLLDGNLSNAGSTTAVTNVKTTLATEKVAATAGDYTSTAVTALAANEGEKNVFSVSLSNGKSIDVALTLKKDDAGAFVYEDEKGNQYDATAGTATELGDALVSAMKNTELGKNFKIEHTAGAIKLTSLEKGTAAPQVTGFGEKVLNADGTVKSQVTQNVVVTDAADSYKTANTNNIKTYDPAGTASATVATKPEDGVFEVNGKKFLLVKDGTDISAVDKGITVISTADGDPTTAATGAEMADIISQKTGLTVSFQAAAGGNPPVLEFKAGQGTTGQGGLTLQVGDTNDDFNKVTVSVDDLSAKGIGTEGLDVATQSSAGFAVQTIKDAINQVSTNRANLGSLQNRLEHTINNLDTTAENMSAANSRIRDTDMAKEMMNYTKMNVLVQSAQAMLAQANQQPQSILQLLQ